MLNQRNTNQKKTFWMNFCRHFNDIEKAGLVYAIVLISGFNFLDPLQSNVAYKGLV